MWAGLSEVTSDFLRYGWKMQGVLEVMLAELCLRLFPLAYWESWLLQNHLDGKVTRERNHLQKRSKRSTMLCSLCWYCVLLQGKVAPSQTRATPRWVQHISNRAQTTDVCQVETTCKASGGRCQGWSGLQHHPEASTVAVCKLSSLWWYYLLVRSLQRCKRWKEGHHEKLTV